ncbi:MAG TPA: histone deacetylase [Candidatus Dormibacteraeota bacterium]|nr:histone deacetylase [Candidatus Dormibacteraeota bacterium]
MSVGRVRVLHDREAAAAHGVPGHPESPARLVAVLERLAGDPELAGLSLEAATPADPAVVGRVHTAAHIRAVAAAAAGGGRWIDADTYCTPGSYRAALHAVGAAVAGVRQVLDGPASAALALVRPPGHHATRERAMGFCLFNNAAIAVRSAQAEAGVGRVAIIDIDVHHGNGTQDIFYDDPAVLYCSLHQLPLYPGSGLAAETGGPDAVGTTLNCPLAPGTGDDEWLAAFDATVAPAVRRHRPELLVVSAGYDAHAADPLAGLRLSTRAYHAIGRRVAALAGELCAGRSLWLLEGGYDLPALAASVDNTVRALAGLAALPQAPVRPAPGA